MAIQLPSGVMVEVDLPPHSVLPGCITDKADGISAAVNTSHFPVLRKLHFDGINERLANWR